MKIGMYLLRLGHSPGTAGLAHDLQHRAVHGGCGPADLRPRALASAYQAPSGIRAVYEHGEQFERDRASSALHGEHLCQARAPTALHGDHLCHARASQAVLGDVYGQGRAQHGVGALGSNLHDCTPARSCDLPRHGVGVGGAGDGAFPGRVIGQ